MPEQPLENWAHAASLQEAVNFTGADVSALVILPDDDFTLELAADFLQKVQELSEAGELTDLTSIEDRALAEFGVDNEEGRGRFINLVNLQSLTVSTFRNKVPVRALGQVNPRGYARGSRTIGGTLILTEYDRDPFWGLMRANAPASDQNTGDGGAPILADQLSPFDLVLLFQNEMGDQAYRYMYGVDLGTTGVVYSIQDMYHESTMSFTCRDVTPLTPIEGIKQRLGFLNSERGQQTGAHPTVLRIPGLSHVTGGREILKRYRLRKNAANQFR